MKRETRNTLIFIAFLLAAGLANVLSRMLDPAVASLMTALNYVILTGLLLFWIQSVRTRLLPSAAGRYILGAAFLMLLYMLLRIFKYRCAVEPAVLRFGVYGYWVPQLLVPTLFLMTCLRIRRGEREEEKPKEALLLIPAGLLALSVLTNDLHTLVYVPKIPLADSAVDTGTYGYGPLFYLVILWMVLPMAAGGTLLVKSAGRVPKRALRWLAGAAGLWLGLILLVLLVIDPMDSPRPFNVPDIHTFSLLAMFEICIRQRLIPCNENYPGFFRALQLPVLITDRRLAPAFRTEAALPASRQELEAALTGPVEQEGDRRLSGKPIRGGYAFWTEDLSAVRRARERLLEANETLEQENDLIRAETEQKEKDAWLRSRHRIYHDIARELYPLQKRIGSLLAEAEPGTEDFRRRVAEVSVLNAWVKRKSNLLLLAAENPCLSLRELALALEESAAYLSLAGLQTTVNVPGEELLPAGEICRLYDGFHQLADWLRGKAPSLMVSWNGDGLRLTADAEAPAEPPVPGMELVRRDGVLYMFLPAERGAAS